MLSPRATVIIPTHRGAARLPTLLRALAAQDCADPFDVVVVVDGGDAATQEVVAEHEGSLDLALVVHEQNQGVGAAMASGCAVATGEILVRIDDDITPSPDFLRRHLAWHEPGTDRGVISVTRDVDVPTPYGRAYGGPANERARHDAYARPADLRWIGWAACNSVRKASYERAGGFDADLTYSEDMDLGYRLWRAGVEIIVDPALEVEHRGPVRTAEDRVARAYVSGAARGSSRYQAAFAGPPLSPVEVSHIDRLWATAVSCAARRISSPGRARAWGAVLDRVLPLVPRPVGRKLVALAVEASGTAGSADAQAASAWERSV